MGGINEIGRYGQVDIQEYDEDGVQALQVSISGAQYREDVRSQPERPSKSPPPAAVRRT
jgi:hypothetical protein